MEGQRRPKFGLSTRRVGHIVPEKDVEMKSPPYLCRWPNGDFSIVVAATRQDAVAQLDEWAGAEVASLDRQTSPGRAKLG